MHCKVSVLVTFYNQKGFVDRALNSVIKQKTDFDYEILVGDDGSNDGTEEIVKRWIQRFPEKIKLYHMDRDDAATYIGGFRASQNRINLLNQVQGDFFIFLDGDDYFDNEEKLAKQVAILEDEFNQDCIACAHNTIMELEDGTRKPLSPSRLREGKYEAKKYWRRLYFHTDSLLVRSSVINNLPLKMLENNFNDNLITFSLIQHGSIYYFPEQWAVYAQTGTGIWTSGNAIKNQLRNMMIFDLCNKINPDFVYETEIRIAFAWLVLLLKRKKIDKTALQAYANEIENKELEYSRMWLDYGNLNVKDKLGLILKCMKVSTERGLDELFRRCGL